MSIAMTPSTSWPVDAFHICVASCAFASKRGDDARLRHSRFGSSQPHRSARSPVSGTRASGRLKSTTDRTGPRCNEPSAVDRTPTLRNAPEPTRISELFAASRR